MRLESVSIAKGFAIMAMVLAHTWFNIWGDRWINMWHMPLFVFFAGYCFKSEYLNDVWLFFRKRVQGLYVPFVKWGVSFLLLHNLFASLHLYGDALSIAGILKGVANAFRMQSHECLLGGYWFLKALFYGSILSCLAVKWFKKGVGVVILATLTMLFAFFDIHIPVLSVSATEFYAALFFVLGYVYKSDAEPYLRSLPIWIVPVGVIATVMAVLFWRSSLIAVCWWKVLPYTCSALLGILAVFRLSQVIAKFNNTFKSAMVYIGNNTLSILTFHFLSFRLVSFIIVKVYDLPISHMSDFPVIVEYSCGGWWCLPYFIVGVGMPLLLSRWRFFRN